MNAEQRAGHCFKVAAKRGDDHPSENEVADAIVDAESDKEQEFIGWLYNVDPKLAARRERDLELAMLEDAI